MNYVEFQVGNELYKLRLDIRNTIALEKHLGCNPMGIFGKGDTVPSVTQMTAILWAAMQKYHSGTNLDAAYNIFEDYLNDGHTITDFVPVILDVYRESGIITKAGGAKN